MGILSNIASKAASAATSAAPKAAASGAASDAGQISRSISGSIGKEISKISTDTSSFKQAANQSNQNFSKILKDIYSVFSKQSKEMSGVTGALEDTKAQSQQTAAKITTTNDLLQQSIDIQTKMLVEIKGMSKLLTSLGKSTGGGGKEDNENIISKGINTIAGAAGAAGAAGGHAAGAWGKNTSGPGETPGGFGGKDQKTPATFDSQAPDVMKKLMKDFSLTKEQAAGIVGNLGHESAGLQAGIQEKGKAAGTGGLGWAQWTGPRRKAFEQYLKETDQRADDPAANYGFLKKELQTTHKNALAAVRKTKTVGEAATEFEHKFEVSADYNQRTGEILKPKNVQSRMNYANKALNLHEEAAKAEANKGKGADQTAAGGQKGGADAAPVPGGNQGGAGAAGATGSGGQQGEGGADAAPVPGGDKGAVLGAVSVGQKDGQQTGAAVAEDKGPQGVGGPAGARNAEKGSTDKAVGSATGNVDLQKYSNKDASHIRGLQPDFASKLGKFLQAAEESGNGIRINSGFRSEERQKELYNAAVKKYGSEEKARHWVAPPGKSNHNKGLAVDLGFTSEKAKGWAHQNASKFGLGFRMGHEPWHIEGSGSPSEQSGGEDAQRVGGGGRALGLMGGSDETSGLSRGGSGGVGGMGGMPMGMGEMGGMMGGMLSQMMGGGMGGMAGGMLGMLGNIASNLNPVGSAQAAEAPVPGAAPAAPAAVPAPVTPKIDVKAEALKSAAVEREKSEAEAREAAKKTAEVNVVAPQGAPAVPHPAGESSPDQSSSMLGWGARLLGTYYSDPSTIGMW